MTVAGPLRGSWLESERCAGQSAQGFRARMNIQREIVVIAPGPLPLMVRAHLPVLADRRNREHQPAAARQQSQGSTRGVGRCLHHRELSIRQSTADGTA
eukprot:scaffold8106_cov107-Isochrysis_galbana.AAC.10